MLYTVKIIPSEFSCPKDYTTVAEDLTYAEAFALVNRINAENGWNVDQLFRTLPRASIFIRGN